MDSASRYGVSPTDLNWTVMSVHGFHLCLNVVRGFGVHVLHSGVPGSTYHVYVTQRGLVTSRPGFQNTEPSTRRLLSRGEKTHSFVNVSSVTHQHQ